MGALGFKHTRPKMYKYDKKLTKKWTNLLVGQADTTISRGRGILRMIRHHLRTNQRGHSLENSLS